MPSFLWSNNSISIKTDLSPFPKTCLICQKFSMLERVQNTILIVISESHRPLSPSFLFLLPTLFFLGCLGTSRTEIDLINPPTPQGNPLCKLTFSKYSNLRNSDANFSCTGSKYLHIHLAAQSIGLLLISCTCVEGIGLGGGVLKQMLGSDGHAGEGWLALFGHWLTTGAQQNHLLAVKWCRGERKEEKAPHPKEASLKPLCKQGNMF